MAPVSPRAALGYALSREMAILYGVVLAGYVGMLQGAWIGTGWVMRGGGGGFVGQILSAVRFLRPTSRQRVSGVRKFACFSSPWYTIPTIFRRV